MTEKEKAAQLFLEGYNCSQSVFTAFCHRFGMDEDIAKTISAGLGGGIGRQREVCGAVSAAAMVLGCVAAPKDGTDSEGKTRNYQLVRDFSEKFAAIHGSIICRDMLKETAKSNSAAPEARTAEYYKNRPCLKAVEDAAEILSRMIEEYQS